MVGSNYGPVATRAPRTPWTSASCCRPRYMRGWRIVRCDGNDYLADAVWAGWTYSAYDEARHRRFLGLGRCRTSIDAEGDDVSISCLSTTRQPGCLTAYLEHPPTGLKNPESHICIRDYAPTLVANFWPDALHRMGGEIRFYDFSGLVRFPVDGSKVATARVIIKTYDVRDHFTRHVDTPIVRLADLAAVAAPPR